MHYIIGVADAGVRAEEAELGGGLPLIIVVDFAHGGKYPYDDQLDNF